MTHLSKYLDLDIRLVLALHKTRNKVLTVNLTTFNHKRHTCKGVEYNI